VWRARAKGRGIVGERLRPPILACILIREFAPLSRSAGTLSRDFRHLKLDLSLKTNEDGVLQLVVESWYGSRKSLASIRSVCSHVSNLIVGVTQGFRYKMRMVYAHFPINTNIESSGQKIELRNFLGEKRVRRVDMLEGVTVARSDKVREKDHGRRIASFCGWLHGRVYVYFPAYDDQSTPSCWGAGQG